MKKLTLALFALLCILTLSACNKSPEAQLAPVENVFAITAVNLPESYSTISNDIHVIGDRIGVVCQDGYNPEGDFDTVLFTITTDGTDPQSTVLPKFRDDGQIMAYAPTEDGGCILIDRCYTSVPYNRLYRLDADMNLLFQVDLGKIDPDNFANHMAVGKNGNIYLSTSHGRAIVLDKDGEYLYDYQYSGWLDGIRTMSDGRVTIGYLNLSNSTTVLRYFDDENRTLGDSVKSPQRLNASAYTVYPGGNGYDAYLKNDLGMYGYTVGSSETELCSWINSDIVANDVNLIKVFTPDKFAVHSYCSLETSDRTCESLNILTRIPEEEVKPKYLVSFQTNRTQYDIQQAVVAFNKQSDDYRVVVKDYSVYNTADDAFVAMSQLDKEIVSGEYIPDVFTVDSDTYEKYASLGLYCDLYDFLDSDAEINRDSLVPCVLGPLETKGKLYSLPRSFRFKTMFTSQKSPIKQDEWRLEAMLDYADSLDFNIFSGYNRISMLNNFFNYGMGSFIDDEKATCSFDSDTSKRFIELLDRYGTSSYNNSMTEEEREELIHIIADGKVFSTSTLTSMQTMLVDYVACGKTVPYYIGYPTPNGGTSYVEAISPYAISSKSPVKDGAWQFV
nr:hypothetical protein [Clostridia bacterium]